MLIQRNESLDLTIFSMSEVEVRAFNLVFERLSRKEENKISEGKLFKWLSGLRAIPNSNQKIKLHESRAFVKKWLRSGFLTKIRSNIHLGNVLPLIEILNKENKGILIEKLGLQQKGVLYEQKR